MQKEGQPSETITTRKGHARRNVVIVTAIVLMVSFIFLAPIVPLGGYGVQSNLPHQISVQAIRAICHDTGCPALLTPEGPSYVSVSYALFGVGEYLFVDQTLHIWAFMR
ncbi:MAG: hypothetical protein ABSE82_07300 [Nitrososphaerales archaeon]|jgi:hypothetical protein